MRVNVYAEELTTETQLIEKQADNHNEPFYGIRGYLQSPNTLTDGTDDDRSAITYYVGTREDVSVLRRSLIGMLIQLEDAEDKIMGI